MIKYYIAFALFGIVLSYGAVAESFVALQQIKAHLNRPKISLRKMRSMDTERYVIDCDFSVIVDKVMASNWKTPLVRLVVLMEDIRPETTDKYLVNEAVFRVVNSSQAIFYNKINRDYGTFAAEQSFKQEPYAGTAKKLMFFDRKPMAKGNAQQDYTSSPWMLEADDGMNLKIKGYRVECWQNGELIDVIDKADKEMLKNRKLPKDWHAMYFYPEIFKYNSLKKRRESASIKTFAW